MLYSSSVLCLRSDFGHLCHGLVCLSLHRLHCTLVPGLSAPTLFGQVRCLHRMRAAVYLEMLPACAESRQRHLYRTGVCHLPSEACKAQKQWLPS